MQQSKKTAEGDKTEMNWQPNSDTQNKHLSQSSHVFIYLHNHIGKKVGFIAWKSSQQIPHFNTNYYVQSKNWGSLFF